MEGLCFDAVLAPVIERRLPGAVPPATEGRPCGEPTFEAQLRSEASEVRTASGRAPVLAV